MRTPWKMFWGFHPECNLHEITPEIQSDIIKCETSVKEAITDMSDSEEIDLPYRWISTAWGYNDITDRIIENLIEQFPERFAIVDAQIRCPVSLRSLKHEVDRAFDIKIRLKYHGSDIDLLSEGMVTIDQGAVELQESY